MNRIGWLPMLLACLGVACQERDQEWHQVLPNGNADLVVVFREGTTAEQLAEFDEHVLTVGDTEKAYWHRPWLDAVMRIRVNGHDGFALVLDPDTPEQERRAIAADIERSAIVLSLFEDISPRELEVDPEPHGSVPFD